jgi:hypothetical protein
MSAGTHTGWGIAGSGIPSGAYISSVTNSTTVVISANATSNQSGTATLVIGPYGFTGADNTTTFNFPNIVGSGSGSPLYYIKAVLSGDAQPATIAHASSHIRAGSDIIDGDQLQIDYVPSAYARNSGATGAGANTDLVAHIDGINTTLALVKKQIFTVALSDEATSITTGVAKITFRVPFAMTLTQIPRASLSTSSSSGAVTVDIKETGTTILGVNKLTIDATQKTSTTAATQTTLADSSLADDAELTFDITAAGTGAKGLKVTLYYQNA